MRVTNNMMIERSLRDINATNIRLEQTQRDISTGKRIHRPSDDPTANARAMALRNNMSQNTQYKQNIQNANSFLQVTDSTLGSITDALQRLRQLAVQGASGNLQTKDKQAIAQEVSQLRDELRTLGGTQMGGRYIFGGIKTQSDPYPADVTLGPNDPGKLTMEIAPNITIDYNVTGVQIYGDTTPPGTAHIFNDIDEFTGYLNAGTSNRNISDISLAKLDGWLKRIGNVRTEVGAKINRLELADQRMQEINISLDSLLQETEDTDIAQASLRLNQHEATLRAALSVGSRSIPMSLVDFLR